MPPKSSVKAEWTVKDFGGLDEPVRDMHPHQPVPVTSGDGADGSKPRRSKASTKTAAKSGAKKKPAKALARAKGRR